MQNEAYFRNEYPRPQYSRKDWLNLNGEWNFGFDDANCGEAEKWYSQHDFDRKILVPFSYESKASGVGEEAFHPVVWYQRTVKIPSEYAGKRVLLHFQAVDYLSKVWVNGRFVGQHKGGYSAFSFDITHYLVEGDNHLVVRAEDSRSCAQPRGKQRWIDNSFECWYTQTTGIWQTVWLEFLEDTWIDSVKMTPDIDSNSIELEYRIAGYEKEKDLCLTTVIRFNDQLVKEYQFTVERSSHRVKLNLLSEIHHWKVMLWSPNQPNLYDVQFTLYRNGQKIDQVDSYFGMRKVSIENGNVLLNNAPLYQRLLLDQGYWPDTLLTPPSDEAILLDIEKTLEMGFNGVRKHQKVEDQRFLYWCDRKGLLVWSEMAATYEFADEAIEHFTQEWTEVVQQHYNHPSIITWVPFNESWGVKDIYVDRKQQSFTEAIYYLTKSIDSMRPVIVNDGWEHTVSDIITLHDYVEEGNVFAKRYQDKEKVVQNKISFNNWKFAMAKGYEYKGQPIIISEYGGIAFAAEKGWGYGNQVKSEEEFLERFQKITQAIKQTEYVVGYCYTQITDVHQEVNGLLTEGRVAKVDLNKIREYNQL
ncbi:MAG TPA: glycoside hydrolase family 2 TIM barrel-domain containing protein [Candidatus Bathyarchaeia archaeon]|nr:glycoside hydrolase family 2 TIM barrel-domain containing protein [Candidatus Bathyarchaeia archaeon]